MLKNVKAVLFDLDGTLVDYAGKIPPSAAEAIVKANTTSHSLDGKHG